MKQMFSKNSKYRALGFFTDEEVKDTFRREVAERSFTFNVLSIAQAASELTAMYPANVDLAAAVVAAWKEISHGMLLGRALWNMRTKTLLGIIGWGFTIASVVEARGGAAQHLRRRCRSGRAGWNELRVPRAERWWQSRISAFPWSNLDGARIRPDRCETQRDLR